MTQQSYVTGRSEATSREEWPVLCVPCLNRLHLQGEPEVVERAVLYGVKSCGLTEESCCLVGSTTKWRVWKEGKGSGVWNLVGMAEQKGLELSTSLFRTRRKEPIPTWNLGSVKLAVMVRAKILGLWPDFTVQNSCSSRVTQIIHHVSRLL